MQRLRILEFLGFRCGEKKKPHSLEHGINAYFTKNKKQKQKNTHKKRRGRIASWVMEKFSWNASESTEMT